LNAWKASITATPKRLYSHYLLQRKVNDIAAGIGTRNASSEDYHAIFARQGVLSNIVSGWALINPSAGNGPPAAVQHAKRWSWPLSFQYINSPL
jgi:hypothetical protein